MIRRLIGFILSVIVAAILFIILISFFPSRKKSVNIVNMSYVFVDTDWTEYDIFKPVHWSAVDWSFLFGNEDVQETPDKWNTLENIDYVWEVVWWNNEHPTSEIWYTQELSELDTNNPFNLPEWAIEQPMYESPVYKDCKTPWWVIIKHKESILAYQQRSDVPDICNVQRRTCNDWILDGNFTQPACDERVIYLNWSSSSKNITTESSNVVSYTKKQVVSYNSTSKNELTQPPRYTKNEWAEFDKNWKLKKSAEKPITSRNNGNDEWLIWDYASKEQVNIKHYNCKTSWWEIVQHWQFVRAYELPFWFTNASCRVELRLCVDWELMWSYEYNECQYLDVTYEEYNSLSELDDEFQWEHEITDKKRQWVFAWLRDLFN